MENGLIERVARAIDPDAWLMRDDLGNVLLDRQRAAWVKARAAIEAMREPTETMLHKAFVAMNETPSGTWKAMKAEGQSPRRLFDVKMAPRWRAMIDAALTPGR